MALVLSVQHFVSSLEDSFWDLGIALSVVEEKKYLDIYAPNPGEALNQ